MLSKFNISIEFSSVPLAKSPLFLLIVQFWPVSKAILQSIFLEHLDIHANVFFVFIIIVSIYFEFFQN
ncbi:hypothetical protein BpHYR1_051643 [Brachionus plicatilis]|uniref:Uncharacterized protein n=1 Tax=Brachionus plicatilis TaxID=10195 RepID=A0A3M7S0E9_BRAPC|nr:hypothetical protein BpHYR1_051643 [Brachionus plicatilis]